MTEILARAVSLPELKAKLVQACRHPIHSFIEAAKALNLSTSLSKK